MSKKYNIGKKSDMRKLNRDLKNQADEIVKDAAKTMKVDIECPHCKEDIKVKSGKNACPHCDRNIELDVSY